MANSSAKSALGSDGIIAPSLMSEDILLRLKPDSPDQGSGHWLMEEAPDQVIPALVAFLNN